MVETLPRKPPRRGIYLLPNLFTTGAMFAGFYAIVAAYLGFFAHAAIAVFVAALLDGMDGRVARLTGTQSEFGVQYDSLSDLTSFGLAPALVMYTWSLQYLRDYGPVWSKVGWCAAFLYAACAALRLARFNTQVGVADKRYFQGLASPAAAGLCMSFVWTMENFRKEGFPVDGQSLSFFTPVLAVVAGLLMVSRFRYFSFKTLPVGDRVPFVWIILAVIIIVALTLNTALVLLTLATVYALSGVVITLWGLRSRASRRRLRMARRQSAQAAHPPEPHP
ncbi:MAG: CDP-diacylglycerol--serine O-phosphatidyltransferase [Rhodanobacteraceae bacterium]|jgi:CDP-diacylglycerol--serine O-phosphatidyltransferase|nr:MAG: CDP-diacylglycerol--serine O-phosphatidyltransferase [Rhodanobacteraceae bacterium]